MERLLNAALNIVRQHGSDLFVDASRPYAYTIVMEYEGKKMFLKIARDTNDVPSSAIRDMKLLSEFLNAPALFVVSSADNEVLEEGVVYRRDSMNFVSLATLAKALRGELPKFYQSRRKRYVAVDGKALRERRESLGLSLSALSQMLSISRETLYRYEREEYSIPEHVAVELFKHFSDAIAKKIDILCTARASKIDKASRTIDINKYRLEQSHPSGIIYSDKPLFLVKDPEKKEKTRLLAEIFSVELVEE